MDTLTQDNLGTSDQFIKRFLMAIPPEVAASFTDTQLAALKRAIGGGWGSHPVEIRRSIPFFGRRYFIVLLGGVERRSKERIRAEHANRPLWTVANSLIIGGFILMLLFSLIGTTYLLNTASDGALIPGLQVPRVITPN